MYTYQYVYTAVSISYLSITFIQITQTGNFLHPLGPCGPGPCGHPWALVGQALWAPLGSCGPGACGLPGHLWAPLGSLWAPLGPCVGSAWALVGSPLGACVAACGLLWAPLGRLWASLGLCGHPLGPWVRTRAEPRMTQGFRRGGTAPWRKEATYTASGPGSPLYI